MSNRLISEIVGAAIFRGTNCMPGEEWTMSEAASEEAYSMEVAADYCMQTSVSPANGVWVCWDADHDSDARRQYEQLVHVSRLRLRYEQLTQR